ncbi:phosphodiesterase [Vibrio sp. 10N.261.51.F12]|uniref:phosphodiesterase n=1 Tax=Vibrio sp. 10N.261.51.F12 TaxID=3229679 RepID=UPI00354C2E9F
MLVAQLTDLHIKQGGKLAYKKVDTLKCLQRAVTHINRLVPKPDCTVITGDLGDFGTDAEYEIIHRELRKFTMPVHIVPGNHDHRDNLRCSLSSIAAFDHDTYCNFVQHYGNQCLIGLDSSVIGQPYGELSNETLEWLQQTLLANAEYQVTIFVHHPPMTVGLGHMDVQNLRNADALFEVLTSCRTLQGIVVGHLHRPISAMWRGIPVWVGPSHSHSVTLDLNDNAPSSFSMEPPMIRLLSLTGDGVTSHLSYIEHSQGPYPFFDENKNLID